MKERNMKERKQRERKGLKKKLKITNKKERKKECME